MLEVSTSKFVLPDMSEMQQQQKCDLPLEKYRTNRNEEVDYGGSSPQRTNTDWHSFQDNIGQMNPHYQQGLNEFQPSHLQLDDGNVDMRGVQEFQGGHVPNIMQQDKKRMTWQTENHVHVTVWSNRKHLQEEVGEKMQDKTLPSWFKVIVPGGIKYDKTWLINSIQSRCRVPFTPLDFHYLRKTAQFFVQDTNIACALRDVSYKIYDEENQKIPIIIKTSAGPYSVQCKMQLEEVEQLKLTVRQRYDVSQKSLNLQKLRIDPGSAGLGTDIILNQRKWMAATLKIIKKDFCALLSLDLRENKLRHLDDLSNITQIAPTLKILNLSRNELNSTWELRKIGGLNLEQLWLEENPFCNAYRNRSTYISVIKKCFPKLLCLDGQYLAPPIPIDTGRQHLITRSKENCKVCNDQKNLVLQFVQQYYLIYDFGDRRTLHSAYHDEACFSLTVSVNTEDLSSSSLFEYFKDNSNTKNHNLRFQLLKRTKCEIVRYLCVLPKTRHYPSSHVDPWFFAENMIYFCVSGIFTDLEGRSHGCVRAFTQTFIATPTSSSSLCVVNEDLFVRDATSTEAESVLSTQVLTAPYCSEPMLSQEQREMALVFSMQCGTKSQWAEKYLHDSNWNYTRAVQDFSKLKTAGKIPKEAFEYLI